MAALVIGNAAYPSGNELKNPGNDAHDLSQKLKGYGFNVLLTTDGKIAEMDKQLKSFRKLLKSHDVGLFFFAGHGVQIEGQNYLIALDTDMSDETDAKHSSLSLDKVIDAMEKSNAITKIIILDACRNNPWERAWRRGAEMRGLASVYAPKGTIIGFATSPGEFASDGVGRNGTYTDALLQHIDTPDCSVETMFKRVRNTVAAATGGKQTSWEHTSLSGEFYFNLSLGKLIDEYSDDALADGQYVLDDTKKSHSIIKGLKSHDWYVQNPAIGKLDAASVSRMPKNSLFVIGRNIYQSACGGANGASAFITDFMTITSGYGPTQRKAILDGMLFEMFFDGDGKLRDSIKGKYFDEVFELQRHSALKDSFAFIADALTAARGDFYALPGKGYDLAVTVATKKRSDGTHVEAIYVDGRDVLRPQEDAWDVEEGKKIYLRTDIDRLKQKLSEELVVPSQSLKIAFTPANSANAGDLRYPNGWTVRKG